MSWHRDQRNDAARSRLAMASGGVPRPVMEHALAQKDIPGLPRLAVESYWRAHALRADVLARALARRSGAPHGWRWPALDQPQACRMPPAPYREEHHARGPGTCCLCGQPVFALGWHADFSQRGEPNRRASWHACCVTAWRLWTGPNLFRMTLAKRQKRRCALTGRQLLRTAEVDHRTPLFQVWRERREVQWPELLGYWGVPNLQVLNREAHRAKSIAEATGRSAGAPMRSERDAFR